MKQDYYRQRNQQLVFLGHFLQRGFNAVSKILDTGRFHASNFDITEVKLPIPNLPPTFDGYRIALISDIHMGTWMNPTRLRGVVALVNETQPDLIVNTGDFVSYTEPGALPASIPILAELSAPDGVLAVMGNHDHWVNPRWVQSLVSDTGADVLVNRTVTIQRGADAVCVAGVDCPGAGQDDLTAVMAQIPAEAPAILLAHEPDYAEIAAETGFFAAQFSGHTHGGQIVKGDGRAPILPRMGKKFVSGAYRVNGMFLYVNRGVGTSAFRLRWNCPPEITVFTLRCKNDYAASA